MDNNRSGSPTETPHADGAVLDRKRQLVNAHPSPAGGHDGGAVVDQQAAVMALLGQLVEIMRGQAADVRRIADALAPAPDNIVGTLYVARKLGVTTTWIADMVRQGEIPASCIVTGSGNGKPWKFHRERIEEWMESR
jgi:hypothetical protein